MFNIETHCHSHHSFDCNTSIDAIIETCKKRDIKGIVICDHDVCAITLHEEELFKKNQITLFKAIEFTTKTDAHIIGISPQIKDLQKPRFFYGLCELIDCLKSIKATIIIPHPNHVTGIVGNGKIPQVEIEKAFKAADFVEIENYRYGITKTDFTKQYPHLICLMGSDAHNANSVGAFLNIVDCGGNNFYETLSRGKIDFVKNARHGKLYWLRKAIQRTFFYQWLLNLFSPEIRRVIKNKVFHR